MLVPHCDLSTSRYKLLGLQQRSGVVLISTAVLIGCFVGQAVQVVAAMEVHCGQVQCHARSLQLTSATSPRAAAHITSSLSSAWSLA
jgi:hypothetical protein